MPSVVRCPTCRGTKKVMGLGLIPKDCYNCKSIGAVEVPTLEEEKDFLDSQNSLISTKKKRKPREDKKETIPSQTTDEPNE